MSCRIAVLCVVGRGATGERGLGCAKACAISCKLVTMMSVDELCGKTTLDRYQ